MSTTPAKSAKNCIILAKNSKGKVKYRVELNQEKCQDKTLSKGVLKKQKLKP